MDKLPNIRMLENISPMVMRNPFKFSVAWISWQGSMDITVFTWDNDREPSAPAPVEFSAEWVHSWMTSCQENLEDQDCQSLTSCWFLTKDTSLGLILLSLILVQIRSCINSLQRGPFYPPWAISLCARPDCQCIWSMESYFFLHPLGRRKLVKDQWKSQSTELCLRTRNQSNKWTSLRSAGAPGKQRTITGFYTLGLFQ